MAWLNGKNIVFSPQVDISGTDTSDATATSGSEILEGYTAYGQQGTKLTGSAPSEESIYTDLLSETWGT